jgi:pyruvate-formate lyase-activating enzyme
MSPQREQIDSLVQQNGIVQAAAQTGVAGVVYTYRCTIACRHCGFGGKQNCPDIRMDRGQLLEALRLLHETGRVVHIAGGEPMLYWDALVADLAVAMQQGLAPHFLETNCSWATTDAVVTGRLEKLRQLGLVGILISADPFHQAHVPPERFLRVRRIARELLSSENVWSPDVPDARIQEYARIARDEDLLRQHVREHPPMMVGSAHATLRRFLDAYPVEQVPLKHGWQETYATRECAPEFDRRTMWEIHVDPYGNIQTNCGVVLGNVADSSVEQVLRKGPAEANWATRILSREGPFGLLEMAEANHGLRPPAEVVSKCDLCYQVRRFLREPFPEVFGPAELYFE